MASIREHVLGTLDALQAMADAAIEAADGGDEQRSAGLMLDIRDAVREEQSWLRGLTGERESRTRRLLARYRLALAQVEVLGGRVVEPYPDFDPDTTRRSEDALIRLLTMRIEVERLEE